MNELDQQFAAAGIAVRFFAIGDEHKVAGFCGAHGLAGRCISDPTKATYAAMGFGAFNLLKLFSDPALKARRAENKAAGFSQNWRATRLADSAQLPGAALIDALGIVRWLYRGTHPGDLPSMRSMLDTAKALLH